MTSSSIITQLLRAFPQRHVHASARLGLSLAPGLSKEEWSRMVADVVQTAGRTSNSRDTLTAWLGDLLAYAPDRYRGQIKEYALAAGLAPGTLRDAKLVCSRIPVSSRRDTLSWSHHCEVGKAFKDLKEIEEWLARAERGRESKAELRRQIRAYIADRAHSAAPGAPAVPFEVLTLMREARALGRLIRAQKGVWAVWSGATCESALLEFEPVADFIAALHEKADTWKQGPQAA